MIKSEKLDFWIQHRRNVLFVGYHGVGKTSMVKEAFDRAGLKWKYFSASTMDPWVDFIGVPRAINVGDKQVLELVRPQEFADDEVEAIFFDEFNRAHKKVRNAVMELRQFRSINGKKFHNLKMIWAAINPDEEERYDVEKMDEAQADRFHIQVEIPYKCDVMWFKKEFGPEIAAAAIEWWNLLPDTEKRKVSPRRLEYALREMQINGDIQDILPKSSNIPKLITSLRIGPLSEVLKELIKSKDADKAKEFIAKENNYSSCIAEIISNSDMMEFFLPLLHPEKLASLVEKKRNVLDFMMSSRTTVPIFKKVLQNVFDVTKSKRIKNKLKRICQNNVRGSGVSRYGKNWEKRDRSNSYPWDQYVKDLALRLNLTQERLTAFNNIYNYLPPTLTENQATETLLLLDSIVKRSHVSSINNHMQHFAELTNHCLQQLHLANPNCYVDALIINILRKMSHEITVPR